MILPRYDHQVCLARIHSDISDLHLGIKLKFTTRTRTLCIFDEYISRIVSGFSRVIYCCGIFGLNLHALDEKFRRCKLCLLDNCQVVPICQGHMMNRQNALLFTLNVRIFSTRAAIDYQYSVIYIPNQLLQSCCIMRESS